MAKQLKVTLKRSFYGRKPGHKECVRGLGIRKMHQTVTVADTPANRGMINKVHYLVEVSEG
jgi:large subunit ribosomal protein L30